MVEQQLFDKLDELKASIAKMNKEMEELKTFIDNYLNTLED